MSPGGTSEADESPPDVVRAYHAAWSRGDLRGMLARADPAIVATPTLGILYRRGVYAGHGGISEWVHEVAGAWDAFEPGVDEIVERDGQVIAFITLTAKRAGSAFEACFAVVHELRDGRIVRLNGRDLFEMRDELARGDRPHGTPPCGIAGRQPRCRRPTWRRCSPGGTPRSWGSTS